MDPRTEIRTIIERIDRVTLGGAREDITPVFHPDVVFVSPDFKSHVQGREACLRTYDDFRGNAEIHEYRPDEPDVHVTGSTAVASHPFRMRYAIGGQTSDESGRDLLVFTHDGDRWMVVWRTVVIVPSGSR